MSALSDEICHTDAERACLAELRRVADGRSREPMELHCLRAFEIATELARRAEHAVDREALLCAAWLHDAGLYPEVATEAAYVADGRRLTERVLDRFGWPTERVALAGEAVERHHELRPQWSRGAEVELLRRADLVEVSGGLVSFGLERQWLRALAARAPRDGFYVGIARLVGGMVRTRPGSLPGVFVRR